MRVLYLQSYRGFSDQFLSQVSTPWTSKSLIFNSVWSMTGFVGQEVRAQLATSAQLISKLILCPETTCLLTKDF